MTVSQRRATIIDVAKRAGVSRQTVTRAVNDMPGISPATRERVLEAAREMNYRPSRFGRGLVEQGPVTLGVVVHDLSNSYFAELGAAFVRAGAPQGWNVVLAETEQAPRPESAASELARRVDALVGYHVVTDQIRGGVGMPVVQLDAGLSATEESGVVELDSVQATRDLADHLQTAGVRRPAVIDLPESSPSRRARQLVEALTPIAEDGEVPVHPVPLRSGHRELLEQILEPEPVSGQMPLDALIAFNDELAVRLLRELRDVGIDVPGRIKVVGTDGLELSSLVTPELTTLELDLEAVAQETVELVRGMLEGSVPLRGPEAHRVVPYRLLVREST